MRVGYLGRSFDHESQMHSCTNIHRGNLNMNLRFRKGTGHSHQPLDSVVEEDYMSVKKLKNDNIRSEQFLCLFSLNYWKRLGSALL